MKNGLSGSLASAMLILCALATLWPATATAQVHADLVWEQLKAVYNVAAEAGYDSQNYIVGAINEGQSDLWTLTLHGGYSYLILGACDGDCQDIDIRLYDEQGNEIDSDTSDDDVPAVEGAVETSARFTIEVEMYSCSTEPCYFGLGVFSR